MNDSMTHSLLLYSCVRLEAALLRQIVVWYQVQWGWLESRRYIIWCHTPISLPSASSSQTHLTCFITD